MSNCQIKKTFVCYKSSLSFDEMEWRNVEAKNLRVTEDLSQSIDEKWISQSDDPQLSISRCENKAGSVWIYRLDYVTSDKCQPRTANSAPKQCCAQLDGKTCDEFREKIKDDQKREIKSVATEKARSATKQLKMGKYLNATILYSEAIALNPEKICYLSRSECFMAMEEFEMALNDALEAISIDNNYRIAYYRAMDAYLAIGDLTNLEEAIRKFRIIAPGTNSIDKNQAFKMEKLKKLREDVTDLIAIKNYAKCLITIDEALKISPACNELNLIKMRCFMILGRYRDAEMMNNKTLKTIKQCSGQSYYEILKLYYEGFLEVCKKRVDQILNSLPMRIKAIEDIRNKIYRYTSQIVTANNLKGQKKYNEAGEVIKNLLTTDPSNRQMTIKLLCSLAACIMKMEDFDGAVNHLSAVINMDPSNLLAKEMRAECHLEMKQYQQAVGDYDAILNLRIPRKKLLEITSMKNEILKKLDGINNGKPKSPEFSTKYSNSNNEKTDNRNFFENLSQDFNESKEKRHFESRYSFSAADKDKNYFKEFIRKPKTNDEPKAAWQTIQGDLKNREASAAYESGHYIHAQTLYSAALSFCPNNVIFLNNRSACRIKMERYKEALADALKAIEIDSSHWKGYLRAINIFLILGDINQAENFIKKLEVVTVVDSLKFNEIPKLVQLKECQIKIDQFYNERNFKECLKFLESAMKISNACENYENLKAECAVMLGLYDEADAIVTNALARSPSRSYMIFVQGLKCYYESSLEISISLFENVLKMDPDFRKAIKYRELAKLMIKISGQALEQFKNQSYATAHDLYSSAIGIDASNKKFISTSLYNRGSTSFKLRNFKNAYNDFTEVLKIGTTHVKALAKRAHSHFKLLEYEDCLIDCEEVLKLQVSDDINKLMEDAKFQIKITKTKSRFDILGVTNSATGDEIKKAFRKFSLLYHSDKNPDATAIDKRKLERKFQQIKDAYDWIKANHNL